MSAPLRLLFAAASYFACAILSFNIAMATSSIAVVWPAAGVGYAMALLWGRKIIPATMAADFAATLFFAPPLQSLLFACGNGLALYAGCRITSRFGGRREFYLHPRGMFVFIASVLALSVISSAVGTATEYALANLPGCETARIWWLWLLGDFTGVTLVAPLILALARMGLRGLGGNLRELAAIFCCALLTGFLLLTGTNFFAEGYPTPFILMPFFVWGAFRLGHREFYSLLLALAAIAVWATHAGYQLFPTSSATQSYLLLQSYFVIIALLCLLVHSVVSERARAYASALRSRDALAFGLADLAEMRDQETGEHLLRTKRYLRLLIRGLKEGAVYEEQLNDGRDELIAEAGPLHDIGKVGVPDAILRKPGGLTPEEFEEIKRHPEYGVKTLERIISSMGGSDFMDVAREIIQSHHEKWDGSGYPRGLSGKNIPLSSRLMALADVYDALTSSRVYRARMTHDQAREIILQGRGAHFDPQVVDAFLRMEREFFQTSRRHREADDRHPVPGDPGTPA
ncbi:MASE1 domain-containing protein [Fundidesulfovibrio soli]|uniref:MASE1 domain-containing protein n=1 Tax=Fundidesulfovibrio soli TaxID=2922716 RepID=UPI001FAF7540